jgi:glutathione S-transferase
MRYELFYWPTIQGRGEFVRLALEEAGAAYVDVARESESSGGGVPALMRLLNAEAVLRPPFAPPILKAGDVLLAQTANILQFLGPRLGLAPESEADRLWVHQLQLTITDLVHDVHDTHHPIASSLYYEEQKPEAKRRATHVIGERLPKFLGYFERVIARNPNGDGYMVGNRLTYVDLSIFQIVSGLRYMFPRAMQRLEPACARVVALHDRVKNRPRIATYLASPRRIPFNDKGIFRNYPELDG